MQGRSPCTSLGWPAVPRAALSARRNSANEPPGEFVVATTILGIWVCTRCDSPRRAAVAARKLSKNKIGVDTTLQKSKFPFQNKEVLLRKTFLSDSGRSRPPPKPPAVLVGSGGFAPRTPFGHRAPERFGVYSAKQQFTFFSYCIKRE